MQRRHEWKRPLPGDMEVASLRKLKKGWSRPKEAHRLGFHRIYGRALTTTRNEWGWEALTKSICDGNETTKTLNRR